VLCVALTRAWWMPLLGRSMVCDQRAPAGEVLVIDNFDNDFGLFRRAAKFERAGVAQRVIVPVAVSQEEDAARAAREAAVVFVRVAGLLHAEIIPIPAKEPISLNVAFRIRDFLVQEHIRSVTVLSSTFRSRRSELIYETVLAESGINSFCLPVGTDPTEWVATWHGIEEAGMQFLKLQYYRFWVIPFRSGSSS
jgi:hypothetical protein